ncbi:MAG: hypothetical protein HY673_24330 [Chloroflexi bacterium]|nr:hypothetical protein [Chloroflexota bacterium]
MDSNDALFIAQFRVGTRDLSTMNAENAASPQHNSPWDIIDIADALFINQMQVGMRNEFFDWLGSSVAASKEGGRATVEAGSLAVVDGRTVRIPVTFKNITGSGGLGAYDLRITYDPRLLRVNSVEAGGPPFGAPLSHRIDNAAGAVLMVGTTTQVPGMNKDGVIPYLNVSASPASKAQSAAIIVQVRTLSDIFGNPVTAQVTNASLTVN